MIVTDLIEKKKHQKPLTKEEINFLINGYVKKAVPDYQMSAFLMAVWFNGMNKQEIAHLTEAMKNSGQVFDLTSLNCVTVDKHSTGGVGDKVSLILGPVVASLGLTMAKMSGRGLGLTGGTLDKLESIPGFSTNLSFEDFLAQVKAINLAIIGQSTEVVPADKLIYALRDVTGTIDSLPLISSSIMSKKLATGSDIILLDVKCGSGAFMTTQAAAEELAKSMIEIGKSFQKKVMAEITDMEEPLGRAIGNRNEVLEAIEVLSNGGPNKLRELIISSSSILVHAAGKAKTLKQAKELVLQVLANGAALAKFKEFVSRQGGDLKLLFSPKFWVPKYQLKVHATQDGYMQILNAQHFAHVALELGAGRKKKTDKIDFDAGINLHKITGEAVKKGDVIFTLASSKPIPSHMAKELTAAFTYTIKPMERPIILAQLS